MMNIENSKIRKSRHVEIRDILNAHLNSLAYPMDSFLEDCLTDSEIFSIVKEEEIIGYAAVQGDYLLFFHVILQEFKSAPAIFEESCT